MNIDPLDASILEDAPAVAAPARVRGLVVPAGVWLAVPAAVLAVVLVAIMILFVR